MAIRRVLRTELLDGSVVSTVCLGMACPGPFSALEAFCAGDEVQPRLGFDYYYETALLVGEESRTLRRHKTEAEAIVWHEDYLDKVLGATNGNGSR